MGPMRYMNTLVDGDIISMVSHTMYTRPVMKWAAMRKRMVQLYLAG